jgi:hypothetical protein
LAAALKVTGPGPVPLLPPVMVSHPTFEEAAQEHPPAMFTKIGAPAPAPDPIDSLAGFTEAVQSTAVPDWETVAV